MDPYRVLGVAREDEIRAGYRHLVKAYHPDLHPGDPTAAEGILKINAAYEAIGEASARAEWDAAHPAPGPVNWSPFGFAPPIPTPEQPEAPTAAWTSPRYRRSSLPVRLLRELGGGRCALLVGGSRGARPLLQS
jgi:curved DNA-binding protein CbpA